MYIKGSYTDDEMVKLRSSIRSIELGLEKIINEKTITEEEKKIADETAVVAAPAPTSIKYWPTKDMTGVDPLYAQLCATICADCYGIKSASDIFSLSTDGYVFDGEATLRALSNTLFEYNGVFEGTNPPYAICVAGGTTMIIGWRGSACWMLQLSLYVSRWKLTWCNIKCGC
jgi:hypothetical protein